MENEERIQLLYKTDENGNEKLVGAYLYHKDEKPEYVKIESEIDLEKIKEAEQLLSEITPKNITKHIIDNEETVKFLKDSYERKLNEYKEKLSISEESVESKTDEEIAISSETSHDQSVVTNTMSDEEIEKKKKLETLKFKIIVSLTAITLVATTVFVVVQTNKKGKIVFENSKTESDSGIDVDEVVADIPPATDQDYSDLWDALETYFYYINDPEKPIDPNLFVLLKKFDVDSDERFRKMYFQIRNSKASFGVEKLRTTENEPLQQEIVYGSSDKIKAAGDPNILNTYNQVKEDSIKKLVDSYFKENENRSNLLSAQEAHDILEKIIDLTTGYSYLGRNQSFVEYKQLLSDFVTDDKFMDYAIIANDMGEIVGYELNNKGIDENSEQYNFFDAILIDQYKNGTNYLNKDIVLPEEPQKTLQKKN